MLGSKQYTIIPSRAIRLSQATFYGKILKYNNVYLNRDNAIMY